MKTDSRIKPQQNEGKESLNCECLQIMKMFSVTPEIAQQTFINPIVKFKRNKSPEIASGKTC